MPRKGPQTRRSVSVRAETYARLLELAQAERRSASDVVEELIAAKTGGAYIPGKRAANQPESYSPVPRKVALPPTDDELTLKPPRQIPDKPKRAKWSTPLPPKYPLRKLAIPEGEDAPKQSGKQSKPATFEKRPVGWGF